MPSSMVALVLTWVLAMPAAGQSPPNTSETGAEEPKTGGVPESSSSSPRQAEKLPDRFVPTDKISPDSVISFPSDI